ncbi:hypothetical protein B0A48_00745 [Cryoendolithus antarcticus]|uniref:Actin-like ATPase domain-containing protein n=1 Tax=Cryoendolithus antarcticus TaxID=1507870 RepID=A0A1V8TR65_9PEZI|nr:hypothetical protein B0A48_00745 [Cryoendolithus antarcticus]
MRNQTWIRPQDGGKYYTLDVTEQPSFLTRVGRLLPRQRNDDTSNGALQHMLDQLQTAVVSHIGGDIQSAHIVFPLKPSDNLTTALEQSTCALNMRELRVRQWASIAAALPFSDPHEGCDPPYQEKVLLTVDYSRAGVTAALASECCGMIAPQRAFHDLDPVINGTNITDAERVVTLLHTLISQPILDSDGDNLHGLDKIILMGELGSTSELRTMLEKVLDLGPSSGMVDKKYVAQDAPYGPLFVASAGAALDSLYWQQNAWLREAEADGISACPL